MAFSTGISYRDWVALSDAYSEFTIQAKSGTTLLTSIDNCKTPRLNEVTRIDGSSGTIQVLFNSDADGENPVTFSNAMKVGCVYVGGIYPNGASATTRAVQVEVSLYDSSATLVGNVIQNVGPEGSPYAYRRDESALIVFDDEVEDVTRVEIEIDGFVASSVDVGRIWVGNWLHLCFDSGWTCGAVSAGNVNYSSGLDAHPIYKPKRRKGKFPISLIEFEDAYGDVDAIIESDRVNSLMDAALQCGEDSEMIIMYRTGIATTQPQRQSIYGLLTKDIELPHEGGDYFETEINILELI